MDSQQRIHRSRYPPPNVPSNISVSELLQLYNPDDVRGSKVICGDDWTGKNVSYTSIREQSAKGAFGLAHILGLKEGDVVGICAPNSVDVVKLIHAVLWCGATAVLLNPLGTVFEMVHCLEISRPTVLAADTSTWPTIAGAVRSRDMTIQKGISIDDAPVALQETINLSALFDQKESLAPFDLSTRDSREHTAVVCFSSGTSGKAKGVELSHYNLVASMLGLRATDPVYWNANTRTTFFAPLCHIYGLMTVVLMGAWLGSHTTLMKRFSLDEYLELSTDIGATTLCILPTIAVAIAKQTSFELSRLSNLKYIMCTGAALPPPLVAFFNHRFPQAPILQGYGMTETNITVLKAESSHHFGSVGKLFANVEARIVDDDGKDVEAGEQGEMLVRGPSVFRRYMRNEQATAEVFHGDWMRTGDVVRVDGEGYWWLTERKKELIKYKGNQVAPAELEGLLNSHPDVREGAVCALWDEDQGTEVPIAYVALTPEAIQKDHSSVLVSIRKHVDSKVAPYKKLRGGIVMLDEIPKSANGKILRRLLPARLARERRPRL